MVGGGGGDGQRVDVAVGAILAEAGQEQEADQLREDAGALGTYA